jgi:hypothetical protein
MTLMCHQALRRRCLAARLALALSSKFVIQVRVDDYT